MSNLIIRHVNELARTKSYFELLVPKGAEHTLLATIYGNNIIYQ